MKGYKAFNYDFTCRDFQYEVGKTYEIEGELEICENGFHFCEELGDVFKYYDFAPATRVTEVEVLGDVINEGNKSCTDKIKIIRELSLKEQLEIMGMNYNIYNIGIHIYNILNFYREALPDADWAVYGFRQGPFYWCLNLGPFARIPVIGAYAKKTGFYLKLWYNVDNSIEINLSNKAEAEKQLVDYLSTINESENKIYFSILSRIYQELEVM